MLLVSTVPQAKEERSYRNMLETYTDKVIFVNDLVSSRQNSL